MTTVTAKDPHGIEPTTDTAKTRKCLRCEDDFMSEWAGERICSRCKGSSAWRSGIPVRSSSSGGKQ